MARTGRTPRTTADSSADATRGTAPWLAPVLLLGLALVALHAGELRVPLGGDDHLQVYRPWGLQPAPYRVANLSLAFAALALLFTHARRIAGARVGVVATAAMTTMAAWSVLVLRVSGARELWTIAIALLALAAAAQRRRAIATLAFALALFSEVSAATLPLVVAAQARLIRRESWRETMKALAPMVVVLIAWACVRPLLGRHWYAQGAASADGGHVSKALLSLVQLDAWPGPDTGWTNVLLRALPAALALLAFVFVAMRERSAAAPPAGPAPAARVAALGGVWALVTWLPLAVPGWHAHATLFGAMGAWLALATLLARVPVAAAVTIVALAALGIARTDTPSEDPDTAWFQRRAGHDLERAHVELLKLRPSLPRDSRVFLSADSSGGALRAGEASAVLRAWYRDTTLRVFDLSSYSSRAGGAGTDVFFHHDARGWSEIVGGAEDVVMARALDPSWEYQHEQLANRLAAAGDWALAKVEFEKLAEGSPHTPRLVFDLAICACHLGDRAQAERLFQRVIAMPRANAVMRAAAARGCP